MLKKIKKQIKIHRNLKYQKIIFSKKDLLLRNKAIKYIVGLETSQNTEVKCCQSCKFFGQNLNKNNFLFFYKKFNSNIILAAKYNLNTLKKNTKKEACLNSYILFSKFLMKNKKINNIHKLNTILKINDLLILLFDNTKHGSLIKNLKKNFKYEKKLIDFYL